MRKIFLILFLIFIFSGIALASKVSAVDLDFNVYVVDEKTTNSIAGAKIFISTLHCIPGCEPYGEIKYTNINGHLFPLPGNFKVDGVPENEPVQITVEKEGYLSSTDEFPASSLKRYPFLTIILKPSQDTVNLLFYVDVYEDRIRESLPIANARVCLAGEAKSGPFNICQSTNAEGLTPSFPINANFHIRDVYVYPYVTLLVEKEGYESFALETSAISLPHYAGDYPGAPGMIYAPLRRLKDTYDLSLNVDIWDGLCAQNTSVAISKLKKSMWGASVCLKVDRTETGPFFECKYTNPLGDLTPFPFSLKGVYRDSVITITVVKDGYKTASREFDVPFLVNYSINTIDIGLELVENNIDLSFNVTAVDLKKAESGTLIPEIDGVNICVKADNTKFGPYFHCQTTSILGTDFSIPGVDRNSNVIFTVEKTGYESFATSTMAASYLYCGPTFRLLLLPTWASETIFYVKAEDEKTGEGIGDVEVCITADGKSAEISCPFLTGQIGSIYSWLTGPGCVKTLNSQYAIPGRTAGCFIFSPKDLTAHGTLEKDGYQSTSFSVFGRDIKDFDTLLVKMMPIAGATTTATSTQEIKEKTRSFKEYKCESEECGGNILYRECQEIWKKNTEWKLESRTCGEAKVYQKCGSCNVCKNSLEWSEEIPSCECEPTCLGKPIDPRYFDGKGEVFPTNIYLPVKLGWRTTGDCQPQSYIIRIWERGALKDTISATTTANEYIPPSCLLKSAKEYYWTVKACCGENGDQCGPESEVFYFKTNLAPELVEPKDPDWNNENLAASVNLQKDEFLYPEWCSVEEANSYGLRSFYLMQGAKVGNELCHPWLWASTEDREKLTKEQQESYCLAWPAEKGKETKDKWSWDFLGFFPKNTTDQWRVRTCLDEKTEDCRDYGQEWQMMVNAPLEKPELITPSNEGGVNLLSILKWKAVLRAFSYYLEIKKGGKPIYLPKELSHISATRVPTEEALVGKRTFYEMVPFEKLWKYLKDLDTEFSWHVRACQDEKANYCESWSDEWKFKTTGAPPTFNEINSNPADKAEVVIPRTLNWDDMPGAASYYYEISGPINLSGISQKSEIYADFHQDGTYSWRLKTCADLEGEVCGEWNETRDFTGYQLLPSEEHSPENAEEFLPSETPTISWEEIIGAKYYQYKTVYYAPSLGEWSLECWQKKGKEVASEIIPENSVNLSLPKCLGTYQWQVRGCIDSDCKEAGPWSGIFWFNLVKKKTPRAEEMKGRGLIPCGKKYDDPSTSWDETEPCQFKHIPILIKNILDFLFLRAVLIALILASLYTGIIFYFSMGAPETLTKVKSLWRAFGLGFLIMVLAWTIINLILQFFGYKVWKIF